MRYTVYKITNKINGNYYIGVHRTNNPQDTGRKKIRRSKIENERILLE